MPHDWNSFLLDQPEWTQEIFTNAQYKSVIDVINLFTSSKHLIAVSDGSAKEKEKEITEKLLKQIQKQIGAIGIGIGIRKAGCERLKLCECVLSAIATPVCMQDTSGV